MVRRCRAPIRAPCTVARGKSTMTKSWFSRFCFDRVLQLPQWLRSLGSPRPGNRPARVRLGLLALEDRTLPAAILSLTPITWDVVGLDSNKPATDGPNSYLIGARITNTGTSSAS